MRPLPELPGVVHRFVDAGGLRMHVAEAGSGDPVVMLHGWPENWWCWRKLIPGLAERYRVICPDLRGFGWSDAPPRGYEKEQLAADVAELLDTLGLHDVRLIGHDWGGVAGFILCVRRPDLVRQYLALNTAHLWPRVDRRGLRNLHRFAYQWLIASPGAGKRVMRLMGRRPGRAAALLGTRKLWSDADAELLLGQFREEQRAWACVQVYRSFLLREFGPLVRGRYRSLRLQTPTLWLHGSRDVVIRPEMLNGYEPYADDLEVEHVPDAGHFIAEQRPELVLERALEFFARP
ncbi:MAG TPA: alpha/beta hydrolase [Thermoleophilaceae bacterium]|jgi:pimeloyl-ACP methyl ester carboxylesterase|nr:alpha/beta hydrolase [Thermoleophilaceae bacterium]